MKLGPFTAVSTIVFLAACGSSSGPSVTPIAASGFAQEGQALEGDFEFNRPNVVRLLGAEDSTLSQERQDVSFSGIVESGDITLTLDGETYALVRDLSDPFRASFNDGTDRIQLSTIINDSDQAYGISVFALIDGALNSGTFVIGLDTDPADVRQITGSANYIGTASALVRNGFDSAFVDGELNLMVDFDDGTVGGTASLEQVTGELTVNPVVISFDQTELEANGFAGEVSIASGNVGGSLVDTIYEGRLFGADAGTIGGSFSGQIDLDDNNLNTFIDGVFVGVE